MASLPDQNEVLAENASLQLRAAALRAEVKNKTGATVAAPSVPERAKGDCLAVNAALKAHVAELQAMLESKQAPASTQATKPQTLTEKVLVARGVKNLAELVALPLPSGLD